MGAIVEGDERLFSALVLGRAAPVDSTFFDRIKSDTSRLTAAGKAWIQQSATFLQSQAFAGVQNIADALLRKENALFDDNRIRPLFTVEQMQHAPSVMLRGIMANPTVRKLYQKQRCAGYGEVYAEMDHNPTHIGFGHYDYRRVVEGVVQEDDETGGWFACQFNDEIYEDDIQYTLQEQISIMQTYQFMNAAIRRRESDPTDIENGEL